MGGGDKGERGRDWEEGTRVKGGEEREGEVRRCEGLYVLSMLS